MKNIIITLSLLFSIAAAAQQNQQPSFTLVNNFTGQQILCGGAVAQPGFNLECVKKVKDYCYGKTSGNSESCNNIAMTNCAGAPANFGNCIVEYTEYCYSNTSGNYDSCFKLALPACKGNHTAMIEMMDAVKDKAFRESVKDSVKN